MVQNTGRTGEEYTAQWLREQGFSIIAQNYHSRYGEIDIIAEDGEYIVFTEVKVRRRGSMVSPLEAVTAQKQKKILLTAQAYLVKSQYALQPRFDVAAITLLPDGQLELQYYPNAFGW